MYDQLLSNAFPNKNILKRVSIVVLRKPNKIKPMNHLKHSVHASCVSLDPWA